MVYWVSVFFPLLNHTLSTVTNPQMPCEESLPIVYLPHDPERGKAVKETRQGYSTMHKG